MMPQSDQPSMDSINDGQVNTVVEEAMTINNNNNVGDNASNDDNNGTRKPRDYSKQVEEVRSLVKKQMNEKVDLYDSNDVEKLWSNDFYAKRFLRWCKGDIKKTVNMILKCFAWRKSSGLIYRKPSDFPCEFYSSGGMFIYSADLSGRPTLYMRAKFIRKISDLDAPLKDFIAFQINQIDEACGKMMAWTIVFDCAEVGWANVHLDMLRYLISTMSSYFPFGVRQIIILDIPWLMDALRKMVLMMLPEEAKKVAVFTSRKNLGRYIAPENCPDFVGGTCTLAYNQIPEGSKPFDELAGNFYDLNQTQLNKLRDTYRSLLA